MKNSRCMDNSMFKEAVETPNYNKDMNMNMAEMNPMMGMGCCPGQTIMCPPVMECPQVRCCHRVVNYEVPQV